MPASFFKQPNGLFCRFSTIVDSPTHFNLTEEEVKDLMGHTEDTDKFIRNVKEGNHPWRWTFEDVLRQTESGGIGMGNMSREEFDEFVKLTSESPE